jgi:hypothetical protein
MGNLTKSATLTWARALAPLAQADAGGDSRFPPAPDPITQIPQPIPVPYYSTWYRRGDIAYGFHTDSDLSQAGSEFGPSDMDDA